MTTMAPATAITQLPPPTAATTLSVEDIVARRITDLRGLKLPIRITTAKCPRFSWDIVVHAYSIEAKAIINAFRLSYAALFREHLKALCGTECAVVAVGTVDNITAESDIDLNIQLSDGVLKLDIVRLYAEIHRFHSRHFVQPYTDLFDMNIYGTDFRMRACKTGCYDFVAKMRSQRYWSFLRLVQLNIGVSLMPKDIVRSVRHMVIALPTIKPEEHYVEYLYRYLEIKLQNRTVDEQSAAAFSLTKYFERDTYRSVGAYLHIVYNDRRLPSILYIDSMVDNLGFAVESLTKKIQCIKIPLEWRMLRVAKYVMRMIDAIMLATPAAGGGNARLSDALAMCQAMNDVRKRGAYVRGTVAPRFVAMLRLLTKNESIRNDATCLQLSQQLIKYAMRVRERFAKRRRASPIVIKPLEQTPLH